MDCSLGDDTGHQRAIVLQVRKSSRRLRSAERSRIRSRNGLDVGCRKFLTLLLVSSSRRLLSTNHLPRQMSRHCVLRRTDQMAGSANNSDIIDIFSRRTSLLGTPSLSTTHLQHPRHLPMDRSHLLRRHRHSPRTQRRELASHGTFPSRRRHRHNSGRSTHPNRLSLLHVHASLSRTRQRNASTPMAKSHPLGIRYPR